MILQTPLRIRVLHALARGAALVLLVLSLPCCTLFLLRPRLFTLLFAGIPALIMLGTGGTTLAALRPDPPRKFMRPLALSFNLMTLGTGVWLLATPGYEMAILSHLFAALFAIAGLSGLAGLLAAMRPPKNDLPPKLKPSPLHEPNSSNT